MAENKDNELAIPVEEIRAIFDEFDKDNSGNIDASELRLVAHSLGDSMTKQRAGEVLSTLDTDGDGVIDFDEFLAWFSAPDREQGNDGQNRWELSFLKARLTSRIYKKRAGRFLKSMKGGMNVDTSEVADGKAKFELEGGVGEPNGKQTWTLHQLTAAADGLDDETTTFSIYLTLKADAPEESVAATVDYFKTLLESLPLDRAIPAHQGAGVEVVDYPDEGEGARAIAITFTNGNRPFAMMESALGFNPLRKVRASVLLRLNFAWSQLLSSGDDSSAVTLRDLCVADEKVEVEVNKKALYVLKRMLADKAQGQRTAGRRAMLVGGGMAFAFKQMKYSLFLEEPLDGILLLLSQANLESDQKFGRTLKAAFDVPTNCLSEARYTLLKTVKALAESDDGCPPPIKQVFATLDHFSAALAGIAALRLVSGDDGVELRMRGCDLFTLLGDGAEREQLGTALPEEALKGEQGLDTLKTVLPLQVLEVLRIYDPELWSTEEC